MNILIRTTLIILVGLAAAGSSYAEAWRGIVPLRSTRADVMRLLNQCSDYHEACRFALEKEDVYILFSGGLEPEYAYDNLYLPPETVMFIEVEPRGKLKFSDLHPNRKEFKSFNPTAPFKYGYKGYHSSRGLVMTEYKGQVRLIYYIADQADRIRCPKYYERPESFAEDYPVHVPGVQSIEAPSSIIAGQKLTISAYSNLNEKRGYVWTLSAGRITSGQYTRQITVDTTGLDGQTIVATAGIRYGLGPRVSASCLVKVLAP